MTAPVVIKYDDVGAPALTIAEGSLVGVLRYVAPLLSWDIAFDTGTKIVLRARTGSRIFYRFDDSASRGGYATRTATVTAYESMVDVDTGAGGSGLYRFIYKQQQTDQLSLQNKWAVIGDGKFFHLITGNTTFGTGEWLYGWSNLIGSHYVGVGDGIPAFSDLSYSPALVVGPAADSSERLVNQIRQSFMARDIPSTAQTRNNTAIDVHRSIDGTVQWYQTALAGMDYAAQCRIGHYNPSVTTGYADANNRFPAYPYNGKLLTSRPCITDHTIANVSVPHTYIPGLFAPMHVSGLSGYIMNFAAPLTDGTDSFVVLPITNAEAYNGYHNILLKVGGDFRS